MNTSLLLGALLSMIAGTARAYQPADTPDWQTQHGQLPVPVWVVPSDQRCAALMQPWAETWFTGRC